MILAGVATVAACDQPAAPRDEVVNPAVVPTIRLVTLGPLPGGHQAGAYGISPNGKIVGWSETAVHDNRVPVYWSRGIAQQLGNDGEAFGIRFDGTAVGYTYAEGGGTGAVRWSGGQATLLPLLPGGQRGIARAINSNGWIVGQSDLAASSGDRTFHPVLWKNGVVKDLGTLGGPEASAFAINQAGTVVGSRQDASGARHAFVWKWGISSSLSQRAPAGCAQYSEAFGINDSSFIVGASCGGAVLWKGGTIISLGKLPGHLTSAALGINRAGDIVGWSGEGNYCVSGTRAVLWRHGTIINLGTLPGGIVSVATAISGAGEIVGYSGEVSPDGRECLYQAVKWVVK